MNTVWPLSLVLETEGVVVHGGVHGDLVRGAGRLRLRHRLAGRRGGLLVGEALAWGAIGTLLVGGSLTQGGMRPRSTCSREKTALDWLLGQRDMQRDGRTPDT